MHPWLKAWKAVGPDRIVEAVVYGKDLFYEMDDDVRINIRPAWKEAGLRGKPYCQLHLRWQEDGEGATATLYLPLPGSGDDHGLIVSRYRPPHARNIEPAFHWLDKIPVFHSDAVASSRQAIVVSPDGKWKRLTLPTHQRLPVAR